MRTLKAVLSALIVVFLMDGCTERHSQYPAVPLASTVSSPGEGGEKQIKRTVPTELAGYNHTGQPIGSFYINGVWGGNISPGSGGGSFVCCVDLPEKWAQGYAVDVMWDDHNGQSHHRKVQVPQYDSKTVAYLNVHFLRSGDIKIFALRMTLRHRDYPLTGSEAELTPGVAVDKAL